jgi:hypothetical protein
MVYDIIKEGTINAIKNVLEYYIKETNTTHYALTNSNKLDGV